MAAIRRLSSRYTILTHARALDLISTNSIPRKHRRERRRKRSQSSTWSSPSRLIPFFAAVASSGSAAFPSSAMSISPFIVVPRFTSATFSLTLASCWVATVPRELIAMEVRNTLGLRKRWHGQHYNATTAAAASKYSEQHRNPMQTLSLVKV